MSVNVAFVCPDKRVWPQRHTQLLKNAAVRLDPLRACKAEEQVSWSLAPSLNYLAATALGVNDRKSAWTVLDPLADLNWDQCTILRE